MICLANKCGDELDVAEPVPTMEGSMSPTSGTRLRARPSIVDPEPQDAAAGKSTGSRPLGGSGL